jgi:hypothetical protein
MTNTALAVFSKSYLSIRMVKPSFLITLVSYNELAPESTKKGATG